MKFYRRFARDCHPQPCKICGRHSYSVFSDKPYPKLMSEKRWEVVTCDCYCAQETYIRK